MRAYLNKWRYQFGDTLINHAFYSAMGGGILGGSSATFMIFQDKINKPDPIEAVGLVMGCSIGGVCGGFLATLTSPIWVPSTVIGYTGSKLYSLISKD
jgi:hypothetical protein